MVNMGRAYITARCPMIEKLEPSVGRN